MRLCVFEDSAVQLLEPLTLTRPAWALWCGASSLFERHRRALAADEVGAWVRPELVDLCRLEYPRMALNDAEFLHGDDLVLVNARWLPPAQMRIDISRPHVGLVDGQVAYVAAPPRGPADNAPQAMQAWIDLCQNALPAEEAGGTMIHYLWDLVVRNPQILIEDWQWFQLARGSSEDRNVKLQGPPDKFVVADDAVIEPFVVADMRQGPVLIDQGAVVHSFSRLEGPCYVGKETWVMGAKLRGSTIGHKCRTGGEVEASIMQGHSNKYHDGFLGHSYLGEWVNLGAGTQTSDLRNDYGPVRVTVAGQRVGTGQTKVGSFIGDHTKTGLGALLNTGSAIGAFANLLPGGSFLPQVVPSFCQVNQGRVQDRADMGQLLTTAATVMGRRGITFTETHGAFYRGLHERTADARHRAIREAEKRQSRSVTT